MVISIMIVVQAKWIDEDIATSGWKIHSLLSSLLWAKGDQNMGTESC